MRSKSGPEGARTPTFIEAARREQIIATTIETLSSSGYAGTSLAVIAKRAGVAKSVISYYFDGKDALMWAVVVKLYTHIGEHMWTRMQGHDSHREVLEAYVRANLDYVRAHPSYARALAEITKHRAGRRFEEEPDEDATVRPLEELLRAGQRDGAFRDFATLPMAVTIRAAIDGALDRWSADRSLDIDAYANELTTLFDLATRQVERPSDGGRR